LDESVVRRLARAVDQKQVTRDLRFLQEEILGALGVSAVKGFDL